MALTVGSVLLTLFSWIHILPFSMTEVFGFVSGAVCVWLVVLQNWWNWPVGIVNNVFFIVLFMQARLFADTALQVVYIVLAVWGIWLWLRGGEGRSERRVGEASLRELLLLAAAGAVFTYVEWLYLVKIADAAPFLDALTTAISLAATYLQCKKYVSSWILWIAADVIYVPLYFYKHLPLTAILYGVFLAMCVKGLVDWRREHRAATAAVGLERPGPGPAFADRRRFRHAVVAGKFYPFHTGHKLLIETAAANADRTTVLVCFTDGEKIPGELRAAWIKATVPQVNVLVVDQVARGLAGRNDNSDNWAKATVELLGETPDVVFSSEDYGRTWAELMGASHVTVDKARQIVPISGTKVRENPLAHLDYLAPAVRAHFVKRVLIVGAESTGKTTLARALADRLRTLWVPEFGRFYTEAGRGGEHEWTSPEFELIGRTQNWLEDFLAGYANKVLICDTDAKVTAAFHEAYLGEPSAAVEQLSDGRGYDLVLVCPLETPYEQDGFRSGDLEQRARMQQGYLDRLSTAGTPHVVLHGSREERLDQAAAAIDELLADQPLETGEGHSYHDTAWVGRLLTQAA